MSAELILCLFCQICLVILVNSFSAVTRLFRALDKVDGALDGFWKNNGRPAMVGKGESRKTK